MTAHLDRTDLHAQAKTPRALTFAVSRSIAALTGSAPIGNLHEATLKNGETSRFDYRGYGHEYGSITHHRNQQTTPRNKGGALGARCMRFK